ncbi:MAG: LemA family protein [Baileyella intestinalis]|uniref:LemA family protein n=1 Tax=Baileyella intestinalis TaxID=2606709 RepID=UPI0023EFAA33|nr:LemA family protein [Baileyella intestinalis]MDD5875108.1 LemA family protein [Baileyella intestinalis]
MNITLIIIIAVILLLVIMIITMYNGFVKAGNDCEEAFSTMDVYLKKRFDLIPNLVETVKGYAAHEKETLSAVVAARSAVSSSSTAEEKLANENVLSGTLRSLFAVAEAYPDLKANTNFQELMTQLKKVEEDIANSRKYYNAVVKKYNIKVQAFPTSIIAAMFHYEKKPMFETDQTSRENVKVSFGA